jgi:hypothetical protein
VLYNAFFRFVYGYLFSILGSLSGSLKIRVRMVPWKRFVINRCVSQYRNGTRHI